VSQYQKKIFWTFMGQGRITEADIQMCGTPSRLISDSPPTSPIFTPDGLPAATLPLYPGFGQAPNMLVRIPSGVVSIQAVTTSNNKWSK